MGSTPSRRTFLKASTSVALLAATSDMAVSFGAFAKEGLDPLATGFRAPEGDARPITIWQWMNGCVSKEGITADLEAFKAAGLGGVQQFMIGGGQATLDDPSVAILNPKWRELMKYAIDECARLGLSFGTHNSPGWDASAGSWVRVEDSMQKLVWSGTVVAGGKQFNGTLARPDIDPKWDYYRDIAVLAVPDGDIIARSAVIDLSVQMAPDGRLTWQAPAGKWTLIRFGHTTNGRTSAITAPLSAAGLHCDMMSRAAVSNYWQGYPAEIVKLAASEAGKAFTRFEIDSYEAGPQDWTPLMFDAFRARRGYELRPWLPVLAGRTLESREQTERFQRDWRKTIAELFADNYYGYMTELANQTPGMELVIEPYATGPGAPFDSLDVGGKGNALMCEFWQAPAQWGWDSIKPVASAAHRTGKTLVYAEAFTGQPQYAWRQDPYALKATGDRAFCTGVNRFAFHASAHNPWPAMKPGMTMGWWGTQFGPGQTWWEHGGPEWIAYLSRCQYMLQQGVFASDLCYLLNASATPKMPKGYEGDIVAEDDVVKRMTVRDGRIGFPEGTRYSALILPDSRSMTPGLLKKIRQLIMDGAIVIGSRPERAPGLEHYPACDDEVKTLAASIWEGAPAGERNLGQGRIFWGVPLETALSRAGIGPDVKLPDNAPVLWTHRSHPDAEIYFLSNQKDEAVAVTASFRQSGLVPQLWHADSGMITAARDWTTTGAYSDVKLAFDPGGSVFVVFRKASAALVEEPGKAVEVGRVALDGPWEIQFPPAMGAPDRVIIEDLRSWSEHSVEGVKHFSGTAVYVKEVRLSSKDQRRSQQVVLDLGRVRNIATVVVNGVAFPALWKPPFQVDISKALKRGANRVEVQVTNLWPNRLIGDEQWPDDSVWGDEQTFTYVTPPAKIGRPMTEIPEWLSQQKPRPSEMRRAFTTYKFFRAGDALLESGLLGPVNLLMLRPQVA
jgi:hypothetical protein